MLWRALHTSNLTTHSYNFSASLFSPGTYFCYRGISRGSNSYRPLGLCSTFDSGEGCSKPQARIPSGIVWGQSPATSIIIIHAGQSCFRTPLIELYHYNNHNPSFPSSPVILPISFEIVSIVESYKQLSSAACFNFSRVDTLRY